MAYVLHRLDSGLSAVKVKTCSSLTPVYFEWKASEIQKSSLSSAFENFEPLDFLVAFVSVSKVAHKGKSIGRLV